MKRLFVRLAIVLSPLLFVIITGCSDYEKFSKIPEVSFDNFIVYKNASGRDTTVDFIFSIKDGDGDIGYREDEVDNTCGADNFNLYIAYEERRGNDFFPKKIWTEVTEITTDCDTNIYFDSVQVKFLQRMQYIEPAGNSKGIEATVTYRMDFASAVLLLSPAGRFEFYIRDRAKNQSNKVITPELNIVK
jgi:hypothetical protein